MSQSLDKLADEPTTDVTDFDEIEVEKLGKVQRLAGCLLDRDRAAIPHVAARQKSAKAPALVKLAIVPILVVS